MKEINATGSRSVIEAALKAINSKQNEIVTLIDMFGVLTMAPKKCIRSYRSINNYLRKGKSY